MADESQKNPFESPPSALVRRTARIQLGVTNTVRYPGDLEKPDGSAWFASGAPRPPAPGHDIRFLVDGPTAIATMFQAIDRTGAAPRSDYVLMINWWADPFIAPPGASESLGELLAKKLKVGVQVRGMFWKMFAAYLPAPLKNRQNEDMVTLLNRGRVERDGKVIEYLPPGTPAHAQRNGAAIHDARLNRIYVEEMIGPIPLAGLFATVGSHHQKILCVKANGVLTTFCGGIDFNADRLEHVDDHGSPLHDVHCQVSGPASAHLVKNFVERWTDHPDSHALDLEAGERLRALLPANQADLDPGQQSTPGRHTVQVGRTLGQGPLLYGNDGQGPDQVHYAFAPGGEKSARALITNAIQNAKKFIYLEDQYFVSQEAADLLATALKNGVAHVTIVVPHHKISDLPLSVGHRRKCIQTLRDADPSGNRVRVFYKCGPNQTPGDFETYVHAKMTIIDDEFAVVGTVNYNRRSWHYDTEINIGVFDPSSDRVLTSRFAHWLRMRMWAEHLFGVKLPPSPPDGGVADIDRRYAELVDGVAAGAQWLELIKLQQKWEAANPGTPSQQYDQSQFNSVATVRPYDLHANDPPEEIYAANDIFLLKVLNSEFGWDHFLDPEHP